MASLYEYFTKDGGDNVTLHATWLIKSKDGKSRQECIARVHLDFDANAKYLSFYLAASETIVAPEEAVLGKISDALKIADNVGVSTGMQGIEHLPSDTLQFTGRVFLYSETPVPHEERERIRSFAQGRGIFPVFRSHEYVTARSKWERPLAFICHDSRDKAAIAQPLALELQKLSCPVWYDEFSLKVGDSLREGIERGIQECSKCILILTPNFLANGGWTKREYDSIFTKELVEQKKAILPVWHGVSPADLFAYSPILADRVAVHWESGVSAVASKLRSSIEAKS